MTSPNHILIIRPSALGDVCRSTPVLVSLRRAFPEASIDWLVQDDFAPALAAHPDLSRLVPFPRRALSGWWRRPAVAARARRWLRGLREEQYDLVLDFQGLGRSGLMSWCTRAPRRVGFRSAREFGWLGYTERRPGPDALHTVDQMLELLEPLEIPPVHDLRLYTSSEDARWWRGQRVRGHIMNARYAVLAPGARWLSKRWPPEHWRALTKALLKRGFDRIVMIGAPDEHDFIVECTPETPRLAGRILNLAGASTIGQSMAVIETADLVVANDSAPLHMAVGFDRPLIGLFGPTDPDRVGPYRRADSVLRAMGSDDRPVNFKSRRLGDELMRRIQPEAVLEKIDEELARMSQNARTRASARRMSGEDLDSPAALAEDAPRET